MLLWLTLVLGQLAPAAPVDAIVIRPAAWQGAMQGWVEHRQREGFALKMLDASDDPKGLQREIRRIAATSGSRLRYVVIVGDVPPLPPRPQGDPPITVPTFYFNSTAMARFGSEPQIATDNPYGDLDDDGIPELAVGRIAADSPTQLADYLRRLVAYETSQDYSNWRRKIHVVAGVGGFGMLIDSAIELTAKQFLTEGIPGSYKLSLTQASPNSPYCPAPAKFRETTLNRLNEGGLFWIYLGHGNVQTLDYIRVEKDWDCIMDQDCLPQIQTGNQPPIALFLACYTGAFDAKKDSLAEQLVMHPSGPIAAIAGSRMTGPYGMSVLGAEMLDVCFDLQTPTLGEIFLLAKQRAMKESSPEEDKLSRRKLIDALASSLSPDGHDLRQERVEHLQMMNLIGDPMLQIEHPKTIQVDPLPSATSGETITIRGVTPQAGTLTIELAYRRDRLPETARAFQSSLSPQANSQQQAEHRNETYRLANLNEIVLEHREVNEGEFEQLLTIPADVKGKCTIRLYVESSQSHAMGDLELSVRAPRNR